MRESQDEHLNVEARDDRAEDRFQHTQPTDQLAFDKATLVITVVTIFKGGDGVDGVSRTKIELNGRYGGKEGTFEWIVEPNGTVNHRLFVPTPGGAP